MINVVGNNMLLILVFWPILSAFLSYAIGKKSKSLRDLFVISAVSLEFVMAVIVSLGASNISPPSFELFGFMDGKLYFVLDGFRAVYIVIAAFMWMMTTIFSKEYFKHYRNRNRYYFFTLLTLGGTMGVFLSADLITLFIFFEIMSFASYVMVIHDESPAAIEAAKTYMTVAVIGGLAMIFGIFIIIQQLDTTEISALFDAMRNFEGDRGMLYLAAAFMMVGFGGKAGVYPLHIWLPQAHPVAPAPASALLSGILTKTGIFGIIIMSAVMFHQEYSWGLIMLILGIFGMFTGAILALFSIDLKRTLAYSSVSQIGFIMIGIGMQGILIDKYSPLAINGTLLHMVNHSLLKLLLFLVAGVVYINLHELDLNKIRGFGRGKPLFTFCFLMGVLGIIGLPFWNGYISKTLLHESIIEQIWQYSNHSLASRFFQSIENMFTLAGGLTTAYMLKIFICVCVEKNPFEQEKMKSFNKKYLTKINSVVLLICALALPSLGLLPGRVMTPLAKFGQDFMLGQDLYFTVDFLAWANLKGAFASLLIGVIIYILIIRGCFMSKESSSGNYVYVDLWPKNLDIEKKIYLPLLFKLLPAIGILLAKFMNNIFFIFISVFRYFFNPIKNSCVENKRDSKLIDFFKSRLQGNGIIRIKAIFNSLDYSLLFCISGVVAVLIFILFGAPM